MSNKTQLQTNNTKLDELTSLAASMKDKAAALPAGIETCVLTVNDSRTLLEVGSFYAYYTDDSQTIQKIDALSLPDSLKVCKNTLISINWKNQDSVTLNGNIEKLYEFSDVVLYKVTGDATISVNDN